MNIRRYLAPVAGVVILIAAGAAALATRVLWWPYVFPATQPTTGGQTHDEAEAHHNDEHADQVKLSPQAQENLKLEVGQLAPRPYSRTLLVPGLVVDRPGESDRGVPARIGGIVTRIDAKPGDSVSPGQTLFAIEPTGEVVRGQVELATAVKELAILTANRDVVTAQVKDKTRPANDLVDPQKQVDLAANKVNGLKKQLRALKLTDAQIDQAAEGTPVDEVSVVAPEANDGGRSAKGAEPPEFDVHELSVRLGETVQAGQTLCVLSSHRRLFVEGQAFESETTALADLMARRVVVKAEFAGEKPGEWPDPPPLLIDRLSHTVNPVTRTFPFYLSLDNQPRPTSKDAPAHQWRFRPGQRVRLRVPVQEVGDAVLVLPAGAVVREGAEAFAFVQNGDLFVRKAVRVLHEDRTAVVLANDGSLPGGAFVVKNQAAALNRALKAAANEGGGHHHDHEH